MLTILQKSAVDACAPGFLVFASPLTGVKSSVIVVRGSSIIARTTPFLVNYTFVSKASHANSKIIVH